jgi:hypothetical protein
MEPYRLEVKLDASEIRTLPYLSEGSATYRLPL